MFLPWLPWIFQVELHARCGPVSMSLNTAHLPLCHSDCDCICPDHWHRLTLSRKQEWSPWLFQTVCIPNAHLLLNHCHLVAYALFLPQSFLMWSYRPLGQILQLFGRIFWAHGKPKSDYKFGRQIQDIDKNAPDLQFFWGTIKISTYVPRKYIWKSVFPPKTLGCCFPCWYLQNITGILELTVYKCYLFSIRINHVNQQGVVDQKFSLTTVLHHSHSLCRLEEFNEAHEI